MSEVVVKYRPRSVSKFMVVIFVALLLIPMSIALVSVAFELIHGREGMRAGKFIKTLLFAGGLCAVIFRPASRIRIDRQAGVVRYETPWSRRAPTELPLDGLAGVSVEANPRRSLHRLVFSFRDGNRKPLTEQYYYDEGYHQGVALALNAAVGGPIIGTTTAENRPNMG